MDEKAADTPAEEQIASKPIIPASLDAGVDKSLAAGASKPEQSVSNGPIASSADPSNRQGMAKRKQSRIRMDSDESESDDQPTVCVIVRILSFYA